MRCEASVRRRSGSASAFLSCRLSVSQYSLDGFLVATENRCCQNRNPETSFQYDRIASMDSGTMNTGHKRHSKSCKRCLRRKQRCHGFPICTNCDKADVPCEQSEYSLQLHRNDDSLVAARRIQSLEKQLAAARAESQALRSRALSGRVPDEPTMPSRPEKKPDLHRHGHLGQPSQARPWPRSPKFPTLDNIVQATVWTKILPPTINENVTRFRQPEFEQSQIAAPPTDDAGRWMVQSYFDKIHPRYPCLDRRDVVRLHDARHQLHRSDAVSDGFKVFKLNMVYAIGATMLRQTDPSAEWLQPESYFLAALRHVSAVKQAPPLSNIEAMALLVLYTLRSPTNHGIWHMIGLAMRTCIDLNLHRESSYTDGQDTKRRLFWTVYSLDRVISLSLRRPFSVAEQGIETREPTVQHIFGTGHCEEHHARGTGSDLTLWVRFVHIQRMESRIYAAVYCLNEQLQQRFRKVPALLECLDAWHRYLPDLATELDNNYVCLIWNKAVILLLRPFLSIMNRADPLVDRSLKAAGDICQALKHMHQRDSYCHSFVSAHTIFNAGVIMCYCLFRNPQLLSSVVANSLRACSSTMFVMAERSPQFRKHRDVLEDIIGRMMDSLDTDSGWNEGTTAGGPSTVGLAENDILAVQSLMELSAQQDPTIPLQSKQNESPSISPSSVETAQLFERSSLFEAPYFLGQDRYNLKMLDDMISGSA